MRKHPFALFPLSLVLIAVHVPVQAQSGLCNNAQSIRVLRDLYLQALEEVVLSQGMPASWTKEFERLVPFDVRSVRTVGIDKQVRRYSCEAVLEVRLTTKSAQAFRKPTARAMLTDDPDFRGFQVKDSVATYPVKYSVQLTDDRKEMHIRATGPHRMAEFVIGATVVEVIDKMSGDSKPSSLDRGARSTSERSAIDACIAHKVSEFRKHKEPDYAVRQDMLDEWEAECMSNRK